MLHHTSTFNMLRKCYCGYGHLNTHRMYVVLPTGLRKNTKYLHRYLGTAQQCTEVSRLLWVQGLARCRKTGCIYATKCSYTLMGETCTDVQCWLQYSSQVTSPTGTRKFHNEPLRGPNAEMPHTRPESNCVDINLHPGLPSTAACTLL